MTENMRGQTTMSWDDDLPTCPDCVQGKHANCDGFTWNNTKDAMGNCPCSERGHEPCPPTPVEGTAQE